MHKRFVDHCTIDLTLFLIGGRSDQIRQEGAGLSPIWNLSDLYHAGRRSIYLPGSGLKGGRAHAMKDCEDRAVSVRALPLVFGLVIP